MNFNSKFTLENLNGRVVFFRKYDIKFDKEYGLKCADCQKNPKILVYELDGSKWVFCGLCQIGG